MCFVADLLSLHRLVLIADLLRRFILFVADLCSFADLLCRLIKNLQLFVADLNALLQTFGKSATRRLNLRHIKGLTEITSLVADLFTMSQI